MKTLIAIAATLAATAGAAMAQAPQPNFPSHQALVRVVALCADEVRARDSHLSRFDAYVNPTTGGIVAFASAETVHYFNKCLAFHGRQETIVLAGDAK